MNKKKIFTIFGFIFSILSLFMIFVLPFFIPKSWDQYAIYIFILFLLMVVFGNISLEKSQKTLTEKQIRKEKIKRLIKNKNNNIFLIYNQ